MCVFSFSSTGLHNQNHQGGGGGGGNPALKTKGGSLCMDSQLDSEIQLFLYKFAVLINENYLKTHSHIFF